MNPHPSTLPQHIQRLGHEKGWEEDTATCIDPLTYLKTKILILELFFTFFFVLTKSDTEIIYCCLWVEPKNYATKLISFWIKYFAFLMNVKLADISRVWKQVSLTNSLFLKPVSILVCACANVFEFDSRLHETFYF